MYINLKTLKYPLSLNDILKENPNLSLPNNITNIEGYAYVIKTEPPSYDELRQKLELDAPVKKDDNWFTAFKIVDLDEETVNNNIRKFTENEANKVLNQRKYLLIESDWTQMPDVNLPNKEQWAVYRQQLRDINKQEGFPLNIKWPDPPQ